MKYLITTLALVVVGTVYFISSQAFASITYVNNPVVEVVEKDFLDNTTNTFSEENIDEVIELEEEEVEMEIDDTIFDDDIEEDVQDDDSQISINNGESFTVPFYSQFTDITSEKWKKVGCGIASLAMLIDYYEPDPPSVDTLLDEGINANAYLNDAGWTYAGLIGVSKKYGLNGQSHDLASLTMDSAFNSLEGALSDGPVMVSVHYKFEPTNPIPHLVVANSVHDGMIYYNDPAEKTGNLSIPISTFKQAWKKRYIEIRPNS